VKSIAKILYDAIEYAQGLLKNICLVSSGSDRYFFICSLRILWRARWRAFWYPQIAKYPQDIKC